MCISLGAVLFFLGAWLFTRLYVSVENLPAIAPAESAHAFRTYDAAYGEKNVALTFDDGPRPVYTAQIMDILNAADVPATFFVIGQSVMQHPDIAHSIVRRGFGIAAHSFTHEPTVHESKERLE